MTRARSARGSDISFPAGGRRQALNHITILERFLSEHTLRRIIPYLLILFFIVILLGTLGHFIYGKQVALDSARTRLSLIADTIAANLQHIKPASPSKWQMLLAEALPAKATHQGRRVLLADAGGNVQASAPIAIRDSGKPLLDILGTEQPVTTFGAQAGVMELMLDNGGEALVTVRHITERQAQLTLIQPIGPALQSWRREAAFDTTLSLTTAMLLLLIGASFRRLWERSDHAEAALAESQSDLDHAFAHTGHALWKWNLARGHVHWSDSMGALLRQQKDEALVPFRDVASALHHDDGLYESVEKAMREGEKGIDTTFRVRHEAGHWVSFRLCGAFKRDNVADEPHLIGLACPLESGRARADVADKNEEQLRDAIEAISEAFVLWDAENRLVMCNEKYKQFYKLKDEDVVPGTPYENVIAAATAPLVRRRVTVSDDGAAGAHTYEAQLEDGRWLHIDDRRTSGGGYVSVGTDITTLKKSQKRQAESETELKATIADLQQSRRELEQQKQQLVDLAEKYALEKNRAEAANRAKSEFLANVSHELRTPLNAVIGFSQVMENGLFGPLGNAKYNEYARDIHESGQYLLEVINDVLDMSKIEAGRISLTIGRIDLGEIIDESIRVVTGAANERSIELKRTGAKQLKLEADKRALKQVLLNLLSNAVKFTPDGGRVTVRLNKPKGQGVARIVISDTGIGIPECELGQLGRPFAQVENQLTKSHRGSGLGLAISRSLVEMHGGRFEIESSENKGTTVTCRLPLQPVLTQEVAEAGEAQSPG